MLRSALAFPRAPRHRIGGPGLHFLRAALTFGLILSGTVLIQAHAAEDPPPAQGPATLALRDLEGRPQDLRDLRGSIVVVNFWATWCIPCREEMPIFVKLHERRAGEGVGVIGASADAAGNEHAVEAFVREQQIHFPIWIGATTLDMERLGLGTALPATAIIDRDGTVATRAAGIIDEAGLDRWIGWLLGDRSAPAPPPPVRVPIPHHEHEHHHGTGVGLDGPSLVPS
jgi:thiol-disulfide isomerase/thioredoxin